MNGIFKFIVYVVLLLHDCVVKRFPSASVIFKVPPPVSPYETVPYILYNAILELVAEYVLIWANTPTDPPVIDLPLTDVVPSVIFFKQASINHETPRK